MAFFKRGARRREGHSLERTLVLPLVLGRPAGRAIYWSVFALLLVLTLITFGPLYWMFSSALKSSIEIFQSPPTIWPLHPAWSNYSNAWSVLQYPLYFGNTLILATGAVILQLLRSDFPEPANDLAAAPGMEQLLQCLECPAVPALFRQHVDPCNGSRDLAAPQIGFSRARQRSGRCTRHGATTPMPGVSCSTRSISATR